MARTVVAAVVVAVPLLIAATDRHLQDGPASLVVATLTGSMAVSALVLQPLLVLSQSGTARAHRTLGLVTFALVAVHVGALFVLSAGDAWFALSPDGPTRARMALLATIALIGVVVLGVGRKRIRASDRTWRVLHAYLAALVVVLGVGHAVLTSGAIDDAGTVVLLALGAAALTGVAVAHLARRRARVPAR